MELTKRWAFSYLQQPFEPERSVQVLEEAFEARMRKRFASDQEKMDMIMSIAEGESPLGILRKLRELDDRRK